MGKKDLIGKDIRHVDMLEILSENRHLQTTIKEAEQMLTQIDRRKLPSYQLGLEQGLEQGALKSKLKTAGNLLEVLSDVQIARAVGLPLHQIERLRKQKQGN